jgi:hypothetical protein
MTILVLPSCKSLEPAIVASATSSASAATHTHDTIVQRDTVFRHDSVIYRERTIHDTVYVTKEVYRDRLHSTLNSQLSTLADTIHIVEYRDRVIEHPPEKYVPKFYKWCTALLFIMLLIIGIWLFFKLKY